MDGNFSLKKLHMNSGGGGDYGTSADLPATYYRDPIQSVLPPLRKSKLVSIFT
jgi:hypothetical protein